MSPLVVIYLLVLFAGSVGGLRRISSLNFSNKLIVWLLLLTLISELLTQYMKMEGWNRSPQYHLYSVMEGSLISIYFYSAFFHKMSKGVVASIIGAWLAIGVTNALCFESLFEFNTNMLLFESLVIIALSVLCLVKVFFIERFISVFRFSVFWVSLLFLFYWSSTVFFWGLFQNLYHTSVYHMISSFHTSVNIILYAGLATVVLYQRRMVEADFKAI